MHNVAIETNKKAFLWGRRAAVDVERVRRIATPDQPVVVQLPQSLDTLIRRRVESGRYNNASEVVRDALRHLESYELDEHLRSLLSALRHLDAVFDAYRVTST